MYVRLCPVLPKTKNKIKLVDYEILKTKETVAQN